MLEVTGVTKMFGHVQALRNVDLTVSPGEVLGLVGDNGAGKSTLVKIISGLYQPDTGQIKIDGDAKKFHSPAEARQCGLATVYQDLGLVECLDIASNMFLGSVPKKRLFVDRARMQRESETFLQSLNVPVGSVRRQVGMLSGGQRQLIAIARALKLGARFLLLDEPTAQLGVRETSGVRGMIEEVRKRECGVIVISHDMDLVFKVADRVQVMRLGSVAGVRSTRETTREGVISLLTGAVSGDQPSEEVVP